jgi:ribose transport system substrate-binding protein
MPRRIAAVLTCLVVVAGAAALLGSCQGREQNPEGPPPLPNCGKAAGDVEALKKAGEGKRIAVVPKGTAHSFWLAVRAGAEAAGKEAGCEIIWNGPEAETEVSRQIDIINNFVTQKVDAIVMAACDTQALIPALQAAKDAGITIVTIDSGIDDESIPVSFIATDNVEGGRKAAEELAKALGVTEEGGETAIVGVIPFDPNAQSSRDRETGFREGIGKYKSLQIGPTLFSQSDITVAVEKTENMLNSTPDLAGIFAANQPGGEGAADVLAKRGLAGKVKLVAFDASEPEIKALRDGTIQALIVQDPFRMGHDGVETAVRALAGDTVEPRVQTDVVVVTAENIDNSDIQQVLNPPTE